MRTRGFAAIVTAATCAALAAEDASEPGHVQIPLASYARLLHERGPEPSLFTLDDARAIVEAVEADRLSARVTAELSVEVLHEGPVTVPLLPAGTSVASASVDGSAVSITPVSSGVALALRGPGSRKVSLTYDVPGRLTETGRVLALPLPPAPRLELHVALPGEYHDAAVIPALSTRVESSGGATRILAIVPAGGGALVSWRGASRPTHAIARAAYAGELRDDAVAWKATFDVEVLADGPVTVSILSDQVTLLDASVDGVDAPVLPLSGSYAVSLRGRGGHAVRATFAVPLARDAGAPQAAVPVIRTPVSRFDLTLPGKKAVTLDPPASIETREANDGTVVRAFVPMTDRVTFRWSEAVPASVAEERRASTAIYHLASAEEGMVAVRAKVDYEMTRGTTSVVTFDLPPEVQVSRVEATPQAADWRVASGAPSVGAQASRRLSVFFDQPQADALRLEIDYERRVVDGASVPLPLLTARDVARQRGMVALLKGRDRQLFPEGAGNAVRVGENQLPASVTEGLAAAVAHTFKYMDAPPAMTVAARATEREAGRFDANVDTLLSLSEAMLSGTASVDVNVKAGSLDRLDLGLPLDVKLLGLTGPSIREHALTSEAGRQLVAVTFTQPLDGRLRLELAYERLLSGKDAPLAAPVVTVEGAELQSGRLAVEALDALEVSAAAAERLTPTDPSALPRQLVLRTTNPILLAYEYVHAGPPPHLALHVHRHGSVETQEAVIDEASYRTLVTRDGLRVTTVDLAIRNGRKQFLRVRLPEGAEIWSASVDGKPEKPALDEGEDRRSVLLRIKSDASGFPVRLVYALRGDALGSLGRLHLSLPRPEILATRTRWKLDLPEDLSYRRLRGNLSPAADGVRSGEAEQANPAPAAPDAIPLHVPATGSRFTFEKLYANTSPEDAWVSLSYATRGGAALGTACTSVGTLLVWTGVLLAVREGTRWRRVALGIAMLGTTFLVPLLGPFGVSAAPAVYTSAAVAAVLAGRAWVARRAQSAPS